MIKPKALVNVDEKGSVLSHAQELAKGRTLETLSINDLDKVSGGGIRETIILLGGYLADLTK